MAVGNVSIHPVSEEAVLVQFGETISEDHIPRIVALERLIEQRLGHWLVDMVPSYTTLLVQYDLEQADYRRVLRELNQVVRELDDHLNDAPAGRLVEIPVWYDPAVGYDLEPLADSHQLSVEEVVRLHSTKRYQVFAIGFNPGFAFMGRVDQRIATPRHKSPRESVAPGSVGIADVQTAIYPRQSPGGWQIIGRSPQMMFDPDQNPVQASLLQVGDQVGFRPIDRSEFLRLGGQL